MSVRQVFNMAIERAFWEQPITKDTSWRCPTCSLGHLRLVPDSFKHEESHASLLARDDAEWEPEWIQYRFVALLKCDKDTCGESAAVLGEGSPKLVVSDFGDEWPNTFYPTLVSPSPELFAIVKECPANVAALIRKAFVSSWGDYNACANQIRIALELLLSARRVPKYVTDKKGSRKLLSLHARIDKFAKASSQKDKRLSDLMKAVKWLGNAGSHHFEDENKALKRSDIFKAFDLLQYILDELYSRNSSKLAKLANRINRRKGPVPEAGAPE